MVRVFPDRNVSFAFFLKNAVESKPSIVAASSSRHAPPTAKHPPAKVIPFANVEVAVVEVIFNALVCIPPAKVDVAVVVPVKYAATTCPTTESGAYGELVPIPTRPFATSMATKSPDDTDPAAL